MVVVVVVVVGAATKGDDTVDTALEELSMQRILAQGLQMVVTKQEKMDRKLELHFEMNEHREEVKGNRASQEKAMADLQRTTNCIVDSATKDVEHNMSLLHDQSLLILAQQSACTSHEQFRKKWIQLTATVTTPTPQATTRENTHISNI
uniref:Uncharacterized protein n=1 Tax=Anopheles albimanus TaxID=7167 RepID=A0A182F3L4_ANOAL